MAAFVRDLFDGTSVAAAGTVSVTVDVDEHGRLRPLIDQSGPNVTVKVQTSPDGGTTWYDLASYSAGTTGVQPIIDLPGPLVRVSASNGGVSAQTVTAHLIVEKTG